MPLLAMLVASLVLCITSLFAGGNEEAERREDGEESRDGGRGREQPQKSNGTTRYVTGT